MDKKTTISTRNDTILRLKALVKKKESVRSKLVVTAEGKEDVRSKLAVTAKHLATTAEEKEDVRSKLAVTAENLDIKAKHLATTAEEKEDVRRRLVVTAKEKESVRRRLMVTAKELRLKAKLLAETAKEKESIRSKLVVTAENLATTAEEREDVRRRLEVTAENLDIKAKLLATTAEEKEDVRRRLVVTAKEKESIRRRLMVTAKELRRKAKLLAETAEEKESIRSKLAVTAEELAATAEEKEDVRSKLAVTARQLAATAKEKEDVRRKLVVTAKQLATTAEEKEDIRSKLAITAENLATIAKEKESVRRNLAVTAEELKESRETLEQAKTKDEAMLASMGDGLVVVDRDMRTVLINRAAEAATGWKSHEVLGKVWTEVIVLATEAGKELLLKKSLSFLAIQNEKTYTSTTGYLYTRKDKTTFPVAITVSPFKVGGEFIGAIIVFRDVTKEREVVRMKDEFISVASHELRTPMTAISGFTSMILSGVYGPVNESLKEPLGYVMDGSDRLIKLVSDMLNVSRIEAGRLKFDLTNLDLAKLVNEAVKSLEPVAREKGITLSFKEAEVPPVQADAGHVRQILNNLIGNALKFTDKGGSISVSLARDENFVNTDITDTGMGIALEDQNKLFEKFFQIASQESGRPQGTGLGLYISRELARKMGGELWIESSQIGKGSTFAFSLPLADTEEAKKIFDGSQEESKLRPDQKSLEEDIAKKRNGV